MHNFAARICQSYRRALAAVPKASRLYTREVLVSEANESSAELALPVAETRSRAQRSEHGEHHRRLGR